MPHGDIIRHGQGLYGPTHRLVHRKTAASPAGRCRGKAGRGERCAASVRLHMKRVYSVEWTYAHGIQGVRKIAFQGLKSGFGGHLRRVKEQTIPLYEVCADYWLSVQILRAPEGIV